MKVLKYKLSGEKMIDPALYVRKAKEGTISVNSTGTDSGFFTMDLEIGNTCIHVRFTRQEALMIKKLLDERVEATRARKKTPKYKYV